MVPFEMLHNREKTLTYSNATANGPFSRYLSNLGTHSWHTECNNIWAEGDHHQNLTTQQNI